MDNAAVVKINNSGLEPLRAQIAKVAVLIGMKAENLPDKLESGILVNFLVATYKYLDLHEISLAFELALAGRFKCEIECYGQLSGKYMAGVLNAYIEHKRTHTKPDYTVMALAESTEGGTAFENLKAVYSAFDRYKEDANCIIAGAGYFIDTLNSNGVKVLAHYGKDHAKQAWEEIKNEAYQLEHDSNSMLLANEMRSIKRNAIRNYLDKLSPDTVISQAEGIALRRYFAYLVKNGIELSDEIQKAKAA